MQFKLAPAQFWISLPRFQNFFAVSATLSLPPPPPWGGDRNSQGWIAQNCYKGNQNYPHGQIPICVYFNVMLNPWRVNKCSQALLIGAPHFDLEGLNWCIFAKI